MYFASIWGYASGAGALKPMAAFRLGEIYADLGEREKALQSYEYALLAWRDAELEMRPHVEAARRGLVEDLDCQRYPSGGSRASWLPL